MSVLAFLPVIGQVIDRILPNPEAAAAAKLRLLELEQAGQFKELEVVQSMAASQAEVNKEEAKSANVFVSGWRPAVGWVCVSALACNFVAIPLLQWLTVVLDPAIPIPPRLDNGELMQLLFGMLGLGGLRTYERLKGVANK